MSRKNFDDCGTLDSSEIKCDNCECEIDGKVYPFEGGDWCDACIEFCPLCGDAKDDEHAHSQCGKDEE